MFAVQKGQQQFPGIFNHYAAYPPVLIEKHHAAVEKVHAVRHRPSVSYPQSIGLFIVPNFRSQPFRSQWGEIFRGQKFVDVLGVGQDGLPLSISVKWSRKAVYRDSSSSNTALNQAPAPASSRLSNFLTSRRIKLVERFARAFPSVLKNGVSRRFKNRPNYFRGQSISSEMSVCACPPIPALG